MGRRPRMFVPWLVLSVATAVSACREDAPAPETPAAPPATPSAPEGETPSALARTPPPDEGPLPQLRTGMQEPTRLAAVEATLVGQATDGARFYELALPRLGRDTDTLVRVHVDAPVPAVAAIDRQGGETHVILRVPARIPSAATISGTAFLAGDHPEGRSFSAVPFSAAVPATAAVDPALPRRWADAFASDLRGLDRPWWLPEGSHPWREFAAGRVLAAAHGWSRGGEVGGLDGRRLPRTELSTLMHTTTAATSLQEALQHDRGLRLRSDSSPPTVPLSELSPPGLTDHPWDAMIAALPDPAAGTPEPLAAAAPAEFWYVRFDDIRVLLRVLDEADAWLTPVGHVMEERAEVHDLSGRYQRQLGLRRSGMAKALGHTVVDRVAIVGSDPYLREGSDVTFVFELESPTVFDAELARHMDAYRAEIPDIAESTVLHHEHAITVQRDPTGAVRQHRAQVGDLAVVSTSEAACRAVLDAIDGRRRRLSDEKDLAYMLARDPGEHDGFAFLGDRFIAQVVGPAQKVLAARRQLALAELSTPGYAALLHGWLEGEAPADAEALVAAGWLDRDELRHADGQPIDFTPGQGARSSFGTPAALTPLLDAPAPALVTEAEREAYQAFTRDYQDRWRQFIDPVAVRFDLHDEADGARAVVDVRVLPLISGTEYGDLAEIVGQERIEVPAVDEGLQLVWAVGADSELRRELDRSARVLGGKASIGLGWLGDWVMVGTLDRRALVDMLVLVDDAQLYDIQRPAPSKDHRERDLELARAAGKLPVYAAAHVRNPAGLVATLTAIRGTVGEVAPGMVQWGEHARHRDQPIVRVGLDPRAPGEFAQYAEALALYYVQAGDVFAVALDPDVLRIVVDRALDGGAPKRGERGQPQFVMEAHLVEGQASGLAAAWALQGQANRTQTAARTAAEILLRGDPSITTPEQLQALGLAYFGTYPVSASGRSDFILGPHGASDPVHGSMIAPAYPELPVERSPVAGLLARLTGVRASVAFDQEPVRLEPPARSLHTRFELTLGEPRD
ncbi:MAG: hypothetical protein KDK70_24265 [Myxococcales bacterium]|nr:hypothetical protein [Myxococcales bacterium]